MVWMARRFLALLPLLLLALPAQAQDLPKAEDLMNDYIAKTGGEKVYKDVKSRISKGTISLAGQKGDLEAYQKEPNLMYMAFDLPGLGKFETGTNGKVVWEKNPITGAKLQTGNEKAKMLRSAAFDSDYNWKKYFKTVETEKEEAVDGKPAYKVKLTSPDGEVLYRFFDKKSGLIVKMISKVDSQFGEVETESFISDYRKVGGMQVAFKAVQKVAGQEVVIQLNTIEHNVNVPEDRFELPNDVKQLLKKA
jgi:outer membrane lipoprotein-sorting protein